MKNPIKQLIRQRDILKNILRAKGIDVWIDGAVYYSNPFTRLKLSIKNPNSIVCAGEGELDAFIKNYRSPKTLTREQVSQIKEILKTLM